MDDPILRNADGIPDVRHRRARPRLNGRTDPALDGGGPALVGANWYRFRSREHIRHELVVTTCFVWVVQGSGVIHTGGRDFPMSTNAILRLPWRHAVEYHPDPRSPFSLGTIHLVPWHAYGIPVDPRPPFMPGDPLLTVDYRRPTDPLEGPRLLTSQSSAARNIIALGTYAIDRFLAGPVDEATSRALGTLIAAENAQWNADEEPAGLEPVALQLMTDFVIANLEAHLSVAQIAAAGHCSAVTAERLFTRYTGHSVLAWVRSRRMERAATLLQTTSLRANEVARLVGFADPLYFSRVFRATHGVPPSRYATGQLRP